MARTIKFRGFHECDGTDRIVLDGEKKRGLWVVGHYHIEECDDFDDLIFREYPSIQERYGDHFHYWRVIESTVGQFTGLLDRNGREIYEGDVLRCWGGKGAAGRLRREYAYPLPVIYDSQWCQFVCEDNPNKEYLRPWLDFAAVEVLGTVFDKEATT